MNRNKVTILTFSIILILLLLASCTSEDSTDTSLPVTWLITSVTMYYDEGGGAVYPLPEELLELHDGIWIFGEDYGSWEISFIEESDWDRWGLSSYSTDKKIILYDFNGDQADGPLMEEDGTAISFSLLYRTGPPSTEQSGQVQIEVEAE